MQRRAFGEFYRSGDSAIEKSIYEFSNCDNETILKEASVILLDSEFFKCKVYFADFIVGVFDGERLSVEIPSTRVYHRGTIYKGIGLYTLPQVKEEVKYTLPVLAKYLKQKMDALQTDKAVKLCNGLFEPFCEYDTLVSVKK